MDGLAEVEAMRTSRWIELPEGVDGFGDEKELADEPVSAKARAAAAARGSASWKFGDGLAESTQQGFGRGFPFGVPCPLTGEL